MRSDFVFSFKILIKIVIYLGSFFDELHEGSISCFLYLFAFIALYLNHCRCKTGLDEEVFIIIKHQLFAWKDREAVQSF